MKDLSPKKLDTEPQDQTAGAQSSDSTVEADNRPPEEPRTGEGSSVEKSDGIRVAGQSGAGTTSELSDDDLHSALVATDTIAYELEQTLAGLVNSTDLFDVPAMDFGDTDTT